jgi:glycosyltransferase involved in cell wall biosynthesis
LDRLRIALLTPCFWPEVRRGGERILADLADGLIARGHRPRLITSHPGRPGRAVEDGLPITRHWRPPDGRLVKRQYEEYMTHVPFSYASLRLGRYDIAQAVYPTDALAAVRWARRSGRPSILSYMGIPTHEGLTGRRRRLEITLRAVTGCDATVVLSRTAADEFRRWLGIDARVIHPGVDLDAFRPGGERAAEPTILCAADLGEPRKRVDLLIRAFRRLRRDRPDARLLLARPADPATAEQLREPGIELGDLDNRAALDEDSRRAALVSNYRRAWVSALPSVGEAFGLVLLEALACGTPVVATRDGGMREIVNGDAVGRLFDGDEEELARALLEALELAGDNGTVQACRDRAADFSTDRTTDEYLKLYSELLER